MLTLKVIIAACELVVPCSTRPVTDAPQTDNPLADALPG
jgi:hypothetical protein